MLCVTRGSDIRIAGGRRAALIYRSTAVKRYGLTSYQMEQAVRSGLLRCAAQVKTRTAARRGRPAP